MDGFHQDGTGSVGDCFFHSLYGIEVYKSKPSDKRLEALMDLFLTRGRKGCQSAAVERTIEQIRSSGLFKSERVLTSPGSLVVPANVSQIRIYLATATGAELQLASSGRSGAYKRGWTRAREYPPGGK